MAGVTTISFTIEGPIAGKERPRFGKNGAYSSDKMRANESQIGWAARQAMRGAQPLTGPVSVDIVVHVIPPKSWPQAKRASAHYVTGRPDADNQIKLILDACNKIVFLDDAQVSDLHIRRRYGHQDGATVLITQLNESEWLTRKGLAELRG